MIRVGRHWAVVFFVLALVAGCSRCLLLRSEYVDVTGRVHVPRAEDADIPILTSAPEGPYQKIGQVTVLARPGTSREALETEMKRRARLAGADALIEFEMEENTASKIVFCGRVFSTKKHVAARAAAIVYGRSGSGDPGKDPAMFGL